MATDTLPTFDEALKADLDRSRELFALEFPDGKPTGANHGHVDGADSVRICPECWRLFTLFGEVFFEVRR